MNQQISGTTLTRLRFTVNHFKQRQISRLQLIDHNLHARCETLAGAGLGEDTASQLATGADPWPGVGLGLLRAEQEWVN
jgi:hypothetical protein